MNSYEADISAADYELHNGDVLWWDHRSWEGEMRQPAVVGAFQAVPAGVGREEATRGRPRPARRGLEVPSSSAPTSTRRSKGRRLVLVPGSGFRARLRAPPGTVVFELGLRDAQRLLDDPSLARYRYEGLP